MFTYTRTITITLVALAALSATVFPQTAHASAVFFTPELARVDPQMDPVAGIPLDLGCCLDCANPGGANQSVCGPITDLMALTYYPATVPGDVSSQGAILLQNYAYNGTYISHTRVEFADGGVLDSVLPVHANGGVHMWLLPGQGSGVVLAELVVVGLFEPGRETKYSTDCDVPESGVGWMVGLGLGMVMIRRRV